MSVANLIKSTKGTIQEFFGDFSIVLNYQVINNRLFFHFSLENQNNKEVQLIFNDSHLFHFEIFDRNENLIFSTMKETTKTHVQDYVLLPNGKLDFEIKVNHLPLNNEKFTINFFLNDCVRTVSLNKKNISF